MTGRINALLNKDWTGKRQNNTAWCSEEQQNEQFYTTYKVRMHFSNPGKKIQKIYRYLFTTSNGFIDF